MRCRSFFVQVLRAVIHGREPETDLIDRCCCVVRVVQVLHADDRSASARRRRPRQEGHFAVSRMRRSRASRDLSRSPSAVVVRCMRYQYNSRLPTTRLLRKSALHGSREETARCCGAALCCRVLSCIAVPKCQLQRLSVAEEAPARLCLYCSAAGHMGRFYVYTYICVLLGWRTAPVEDFFRRLNETFYGESCGFRSVSFI